MKFTPVWMSLNCLMLLAAMLLGSGASAAQLVRIGAAHFPPYTIRPERGEDTGLLPELVSALNSLQDDYHFEMVPTSIPRRFRDLQQGRFDMAIFENPAWGWRNVPHVEVEMGLEDAEIFVAHRVPGRTQRFFDDLSGKRLALFNGYHYAFAHFNADPKVLADQFNGTLTYSHDSNLRLVLRDRVSMALVTRSYLKTFIENNPQDADQLLISDRVDQIYRHFALLRPAAPISAAQFSQLLQRLRENGQMYKIFQPYRIAVTTPLSDRDEEGGKD